jgi:hypothetical protein
MGDSYINLPFATNSRRLPSYSPSYVASRAAGTSRGTDARLDRFENELEPGAYRVVRLRGDCLERHRLGDIQRRRDVDFHVRLHAHLLPLLTRARIRHSAKRYPGLKPVAG